MSLLRRHNLLRKRGAGYSAEVQAVLNRFIGGNTLTAAEISKVVAFVDGLVADSIWDKIDEFWWFMNIGSEAKSLIGFKNFTATKVGLPTWSASGWAGFTTSAYLSTTYNPTSYNQKYQRNDAMLGAWCSIAGSGIPVGANVAANNGALLQPSGLNNIMNSTTVFNAGVISGNQFRALVRTTSVLTTVYTAGVAGNTSNVASTANVGASFFIGCRNNNGAPSGAYNGTIGCIIFGAAVGINQASLNSRIVTLLS